MAIDLDFAGRTALVTGAASGIGAACAAWLAAHGAERLLLVDRNETGLAALELPCKIGRFTGDVADPALWERIEAEAGPIDHAVLNAGIAAGDALADMPFEDWRRVLAVNLDGAFLSLRCALRRLNGGGSAVLTASVAGLKAEPRIVGPRPQNAVLQRPICAPVPGMTIRLEPVPSLCVVVGRLGLKWRHSS